MRTLGYVTAITMAAAGTALALVAVRSLPEAPVHSDEEDVVTPKMC